MKHILILMTALLLSLPARADYQSLVAEGDAFDAKGQTEQALKYYLPADKLENNHADLLVKISRQYALRLADLSTDAQKAASVRTALTYAERAVSLAPNECDPHLSIAICLGKLSPFVGARERVEYSRRIKTEADISIKLNPKNDYAWHLLGRWNQALANVGGGTRILAKIIYGGLPAASNEEAVRCLKKAMALNPKRLVHVIELGRTYAMMGRKEDAKKFIQQGLAMPNREKDDPETKQRGRQTLASIS